MSRSTKSWLAAVCLLAFMLQSALNGAQVDWPARAVRLQHRARGKLAIEGHLLP